MNFETFSAVTRRSKQEFHKQNITKQERVHKQNDLSTGEKCTTKIRRCKLLAVPHNPSFPPSLPPRKPPGKVKSERSLTREKSNIFSINLDFVTIFICSVYRSAIYFVVKMLYFARDNNKAREQQTQVLSVHMGVYEY